MCNSQIHALSQLSGCGGLENMTTIYGNSRKPNYASQTNKDYRTQWLCACEFIAWQRYSKLPIQVRFVDVACLFCM